MRSGRNKAALVLGVGNLLLGDEGVGIHAVQRLRQASLPPRTDLLDGGTGGFHLLSCFQEYGRIVLVDAARDDRPPGTITILRPRFASDFPRTLTAHDIGLRDLIASAALLGPLPEIVLVTVSIERAQPMHLQLSPAVAGALPQACNIILGLLADRSSAICPADSAGDSDRRCSRRAIENRRSASRPGGNRHRH